MDEPMATANADGIACICTVQKTFCWLTAENKEMKRMQITYETETREKKQYHHIFSCCLCVPLPHRRFFFKSVAANCLEHTSNESGFWP